MKSAVNRPIRIAHISDLHLEPAGTEQYAGLADRLDRIHHVIIDLAPDLVVVTGDLTNIGASTPAHFEQAREWLERLAIPYVTLPGNHDLGANRVRGERFALTEHYEDCAYAETGYARAFGASLVVRRSLHGLTILACGLREDDPDGIVDALAAEIADTDGPIVVASHYPLVPPRELIQTERFGAGGYVDRAAERLRALLASSDRVLAYLCGHVHLTSLRQIAKHCAQFTAGGLGPGAAALRLYQWDGHALQYDTMDVEGPQLFWETGMPEAGRDPFFSSGTALERSGIWRPIPIASVASAAETLLIPAPQD